MSDTSVLSLSSLFNDPTTQDLSDSAHDSSSSVSAGQGVTFNIGGTGSLGATLIDLGVSVLEHIQTGTTITETSGTSVHLDAFQTFVDALVQHPIAALPIAVGETTDTATGGQLDWSYDTASGLHIDASAGFLQSATGDGGFTLDVATNGSWTLHLDGVSQAISYNTVTGASGEGAYNHAPGTPPASNTVVDASGAGADSATETVGHVTFDGLLGPNGQPVVGNDTVQGGVGDYMIGGDSTAGRNCALYSASPSSVLVDMQHGHGFGGNADGDQYVGVDQVRGSLYSNVLIGSSTGTDLKSGGNDSILIETGGGTAWEMRPDGTDNLLVSTAAGSRVVFDPTHGWTAADTNTEVGFSAAQGDQIDFTAALSASAIATIDSNPSAINNYVALVDSTAGDQVMFSAAGTVQTTGTDVLNLALVHGLDASTMLANHNIVV